MDVTAGSSPIGDPQTITLIPAGGSGVAQVVYPTQGLAGDRKIEITVDPYNFIAETSETDNEVRVTLSVTPPPAANLTMLAANIGFQPEAPVKGDDVTIAAVVLNTGDAPAEGITVQFLDVTGGVILPIGERADHRLAGAGCGRRGAGRLFHDGPFRSAPDSGRRRSQQLCAGSKRNRQRSHRQPDGRPVARAEPQHCGLQCHLCAVAAHGGRRRDHHRGGGQQRRGPGGAGARAVHRRDQRRLCADWRGADSSKSSEPGQTATASVVYSTRTWRAAARFRSWWIPTT